jgi:peptidoglycan/LPS O-acetylase OafA/YrhL
MAPKSALPNLTSIRLLAAIYVFGFHFVGTQYFSLGNTGINLFFVLSGFILAYNHPSVPDRRRFFAFRLARIYPLYALSLVLSLPQYISAHRHDRLAMLGIPMSFALLQTWVPPLKQSVNYAAWTLPIETFFYLCFPLLLPFVHRQVGRWKLWMGILAILLVAPTLFTFFVLMPAVPVHALMLKDMLNIPVFHLGEFVMGMFLGLRFLEKRPVFTGWHVLLAALFLVACSVLIHPIPWFYVELCVDGLLALPYAILIYVLAGWESRWFGHPLLQLGGEISYGIYLLQFPVNAVLYRLVHQTGPVFVAALFVLLSATAYFCYVRVEKPARRFILTKLGYHPSPKPIPTPGLQT